MNLRILCIPPKGAEIPCCSPFLGTRCEKHKKYDELLAEAQKIGFKLVPLVPDTQAFLHKVYTLSGPLEGAEEGTSDPSRRYAIDEVFNVIDDLHLAGRFAESQAIMDAIDVTKLSVAVGLSFMTLFRPAFRAREIKGYPEFVEKCRAEWLRRGFPETRVERLMVGLKE